MRLRFAALHRQADRAAFSCGVPELDAYLRKQAGQDMERGFATVIAAFPEDAPTTILGFYTLSAASILFTTLPDSLSRKMPRYPAVPAVRLGRLAVDAGVQGQHIGSLLLLDALKRACRSELAWAVFLVDAKNERAARFYEKFHFSRFQDETRSLWMHRKQAELLAGA